MAKKNFTQIAFDFSEPVPPPEAVLDNEVITTVQENPAPAVGVRIKRLKTEEPVIADEHLIEPIGEEEIVIEDMVPARIRKAKAAAAALKPKSTRGRKSLKQMTAEADLINIPEDDELFKKLYYSIGEVAEMFRVNHSLIRFWETEFDIIHPRKNRKGDRHFRPVDIKNLQLIHHLLRQRKYTIEGAKDYIRKNKLAQERFELIEKLKKIKSFFHEIKASL